MIRDRQIVHFVSYASVNERRVRALLGVRDPGFFDDCFFAPLSLEVGDPFPEHIERAITTCEVFHLFWSTAAARSEWVAREVELALARWRKLEERDGFFRCYQLDATEPLPQVKSRFHVLDLSAAFDTRRPDRVHVSRLPHTGPDCFGRDAHLDRLDAALDMSEVHVVSFVAFAGQGKSTLVNRWNARLARDGYRGIRRVYAWSFYSGGADEGRQVSADSFIADALRWFGGETEDPTKGSVWDKGERLALHIRKEPTLLILDGLEPLQHPPGPETGRLRDPGLATLLRELAADNPGLCILTSRLPVTDLDEYLRPAGTHVAVDLEALAPEAGRELLRARGVRADDEELDMAVVDFGGHALALTLLGSYLAESHGGNIRRRFEIPALTEAVERGGHARRVMASYERLFGEGPELTLLLYLGLFHRPASPRALATLRADPSLLGSMAAPGSLRAVESGRKVRRKVRGAGAMDDRTWQRAVSRLRQVGLVASDVDTAELLDTHPLVREHFGSRLRERAPAAWVEGHRRLYEHYRGVAPDFPETLDQMDSLFAAVVHGTAAGRHQEVCDEILWRRILRESQVFLVRQLGGYSAYLGCLAVFFAERWRSPVEALQLGTKGWLLAEAGFVLGALGRPREAVQPMEAALDRKISQRDWRNVALAAGNLSELHCALGDLGLAEARAHQAVTHADQTQDEFARIVARSRLANTLHQRGKLVAAQRLFEEAEALQNASKPDYSILFSFRGYLYCDLLLGQGKVTEVARRAAQTLEWDAEEGARLSIALDHLSLARAHHAMGDPPPSREHFDRAIDGLRAAGVHEYLTCGLIARAAFRRMTGDLALARRDFTEALKIVERSGFRLFAADCALEEARLALAEAEHHGAGTTLGRAKLGEARAAFRRGRELVEEMDYGRRRPEIAALAHALAEVPAPEAQL